MNLTDYQTQSRDTAMYPDRDHNLWYPTLGLVGEIAEYLTAAESEKIKEAGDVAWYCSQLCSEAGLQLETIIQPIAEPESMTTVLGQLAECVKKLYRDRQGIVSDLDRAIVSHSVNHLWYHCIPVNDQSIILSTNIAKLQSRKTRGVLGGSGDDR
jgi:NTP pyrophosphatase (non-canonical NTP hydrolase)